MKKRYKKTKYDFMNYLTTYKIIILATLLSFSLGIHAQVTIGSGEKPAYGALLDLKTQQAGTVTNVNDDTNITSTTGGLLLPRVKIKNPSSLQAVGLDDATMTTEEKLKLTGLMVYNIHVVPGAFFTGVYVWNGFAWSYLVDSKISNPVAISTQPKEFTFYETGLEIAEKLKFEVVPPKAADGTTGTVSYQWYQLRGSNLHATVGAAISGATSSEFTPPVIKGTTLNANNAGMYRYYCVATGSDGSSVRSNIAEVAVGCGAKDNFGNWTTFMCFNLGTDIAQAGTIEGQKTYSVGSFTNEPNGLHTYITGEENVYGDLFQWGRIPDGHEKRTSAIIARDATLTTSVIASGNRCSPTGLFYPYYQIKRGTDWEGKFITASAAYNYNWHPSTDPSTVDLLWRTTAFGSNDPCVMFKADGSFINPWYDGPNGTNDGSEVCRGTKTNWRLPTIDEWGAIFKGGQLPGSPGEATANTWEWYNGGSVNTAYTSGIEIKPDGQTTTLYLPEGGSRLRTDGQLYYPGVQGLYWSGTVTGLNAFAMNIGKTKVSVTSYQRASGLAIRCVKYQ